MNNLFQNILRKISYSSMFFWDIKLQHTPEKILDEKIAAILYFKNKITNEVVPVELDVEKYQWYMDDVDLWRKSYFELIQNGSVGNIND